MQLTAAQVHDSCVDLCGTAWLEAEHQTLKLFRDLGYLNLTCVNLRVQCTPPPPIQVAASPQAKAKPKPKPHVKQMSISSFFSK